MPVLKLGYHGTSRTVANKIKREGFRLGKYPGWLGTGVYVFEENPGLALQYAQCKKFVAEPTIIKAHLSIDEDTILDVSIPGSKGNRLFHEFKDSLQKAIVLKQYHIEFKNKYEMDGHTIDRLCKVREFSVVRGFTYTYNKLDKEYTHASGIANGVELCLKNLKHIQKVEIFEDEYLIG